MANAPEPEVKIIPGGDAIINDAALVERTEAVFKSAFGAAKVQRVPPITASEDFSDFVNAGVPAMFFFVGVYDPKDVEGSRKRRWSGGPVTAPTGLTEIADGVRRHRRFHRAAARQPSRLLGTSRRQETLMRAFIGTTYGSIDSFSIDEVALPEPGTGQIRVRIQAAALGFVDGLMLKGKYQIQPPLPYIPGGEIAGVVDAVGPDVKGIGVGQRVMTWQLGGGLAEYVVVNADDVDLVAEGLSPSIAAAMLVDYQTSHYALFERGRLAATDTVLVLGATGGVGAAAVQMAVRAGAHVIAAASTEDKRKMALALGASSAIDYRRPDWRDSLKDAAPGGSIDVVFDPVGGDTFEPAFRSLAKEGRYLVVGFAGGRIPALPANLALLKSASLVGVDIRHFLSRQPERARRVRASLARQVMTGLLKPPVIMPFTLDQARLAIEATMSRERRGKVVVQPVAGHAG